MLLGNFIKSQVPSHQLDLKINDLILLFKTIWMYRNCFLSPVTTDGINGNGLKLEKNVTLGVFHLQKISVNFYWEFPFGKRAFHLSRVPFVCRALSVASPKHQCLGKMFCFIFELVFVCRFPVKQMLIIGMCCYGKSDICMFPSF